MKKITKLVAAMLALVLVFSLCGCGDESGKVAGKWAYNLDMQEALLEEMGSDFADFKSTLPVVIYFDFQKGGSLEVTVDEDEFVKAYEKWLDDFVKFAADYLYDTAAASGMSKDDVDSMFGGDVEGYFREAMEAEVNPSDLVKEMHTEGVWKAKGGKLYISEGSEIEANRYDNYSISGDTMTLTLPEGAKDEEFLPGVSYPMTLKKVK